MIERRMVRRYKAQGRVTAKAMATTSNAATARQTRASAIDSSVAGH